MRINTNLTAMNTFTQYTKNNNKIASSVAKLSSGSAINSAADNATGLAISEKMRAQIRGLEKASTNAQDAISLVQSAEGALSSSTEILQRMRELAVQSASDTNENEIDRTALQDEFSQLQSELNDIAKNTTFNKKTLLDGSLAAKTTNIASVTLANSGMAISAGNVSAGSYEFTVNVKQESASISADTGKTTASLGNTAKSLFDSAATTDPSKSGALYNGNYKLSTAVNNDGTLTVTAQGDNDQTFTANVSAAALTAVSTGFSATSDELALNFTSSAGTSDGFSVTLTLGSAASTSDNGLAALATSIDDVTVSVDGGVDAQAATYGVYASLTGGESVKLNTGDSSVTFSNGITVGFDKLAATDAAVDLTPSDVAIADSAVTIGAGAPTFSVDLNTVTAGYNLGEITTFEATIGGSTFSYTTTGTEADATAVATAFGDVVAAGSVSITPAVGSATPATFTGVNTAGAIAFTGPASYNTTDIPTLDFADVVVSATQTSPGLADGLLSKVGTAANQADANPVTKTGATTFQVSQKDNAGLTFQVGANAGDEMTINIEKMDNQTLGVNSAKVSTQEAAKAAISAVDSAINSVSAQRAYLGAIQNRLEYKISNISTSTENLTSAESQIRDVDMAKEMTAFTNANILNQASTAMLAQANSLPQSVLSLIGK